MCTELAKLVQAEELWSLKCQLHDFLQWFFAGKLWEYTHLTRLRVGEALFYCPVNLA